MIRDAFADALDYAARTVEQDERGRLVNAPVTGREWDLATALLALGAPGLYACRLHGVPRWDEGSYLDGCDGCTGAYALNTNPGAVVRVHGPAEPVGGTPHEIPPRVAPAGVSIPVQYRQWLSSAHVVPGIVSGIGPDGTIVNGYVGGTDGR